MSRPEYDPFGDRISIVQDLPTAPRTDPQSTVPVEPLSAERWHAILAADPLLPECGGTHMLGYGTCQRLAAHQLDAARASQPIAARADPRLEATKADLLAEVLRRCMGLDANDNARRDFGEINGGGLQRPSEVAAELLRALADEGLTLAALPVREDEPTGIDVP